MTSNNNNIHADASSSTLLHHRHHHHHQQQQQQQAIFVNHSNNDFHHHHHHHCVIMSSPPPLTPAHPPCPIPTITCISHLLLAVIKSTFSAQSSFDTIAFYAAMLALFLIFVKDHVFIATTPRSRARIFVTDVAVMILAMVSIASFLMAHLQRWSSNLNKPVASTAGLHHRSASFPHGHHDQQLRMIFAKTVWPIVFCLTVGFMICVVLQIRRRLRSNFAAARRPPV